MNGNLSVPERSAEERTPSTSISSSSLHSQDGKTINPRLAPLEKPVASPHGTSPVPSSKKPTLTSRLSRIFSSTKVLSESEAKAHLDKLTEGNASDAESNADRQGSGDGRPSWSRQASDLEKRRQSSVETDKKMPAAAVKKDGKDQDFCHRRFEILTDGTHEHLLKSTKRQEKLSDMLREMLGGKKKDHDGQAEDQQLSLMSTWIDQLKSERDKVASDKKGGPNSTATLVQKYGKCQEIVGRGAFGIVRISHKPDPKDSKNELLYAVKEFRRRPQESPKKYQKRLTSEFCISSSLRHPNVIHTLDLLQDAKGDYCEVMEFCAGGDLYTLVLAAGKLEVTEADCYFKQLMCGVEYLHEMGVAHRDLKPENLLLTTHGSLKITDFGNGECFRMAWESEPHMVAGLCGSAPYIAPEEYIDKEFDPRAVDVWATGVIYMAMRTGRHLWRVAKKDEDEFFERYLEGRRDEDGYQPIETLHRVSCVFRFPSPPKHSD